ncbi:MAG TPA: hypothetical protein VFD70_05900 [Anaerolineae bacterium]|nr:hypothetical protein [Anaerolineae bacterium]
MLWLILLAILVWLILQPTWLPKVPDFRGMTNRAIERSQARTNETFSKLIGRSPRLRRDRPLSTKLQEWITARTTSTENEIYDKMPARTQGMNAWLATLSDKEMRVFTDKVARFTASLGLDLEWLLDNKVNAYPALKQAIEEAVFLYSISAWRAYNVQRDVKAFRAYQAWVENPSRNRALEQKLYSELVQQGLAPTAPDLYLASESERNAEAIRAIKEVAETRPEVVTAIVRDWVTPQEPVKMEAVAQPAN